MSKGKTVLITGGFGFIGSNLVRLWLETRPQDKVVVVDSMTYAARPAFVKDYIHNRRKKGLRFFEENIDIRDHISVSRVMQKHRPDTVLHLAAESHVCRSLAGPKVFMETNVMGTFNMIEEFYQLWRGNKQNKFVHVSTDEVFGELELEEPAFNENTQIKPRSPYAASKASSDHIVASYHHSFGVPVITTNCSNNFGPNQHEEKLIPATLFRLMHGAQPLLHGNGQNRRDWLYVADHCRALMLLAEKGKAGERYCIGGEFEATNEQITRRVYELYGRLSNKKMKPFKPVFSDDRPTDDKRYAIDCSKLKQLGWSPSTRNLDANLLRTIRFYMAEWARVEAVRPGESAQTGVLRA